MTAAFPAFTDFSKLRILISNDDGIHARGLEVLERIARTLSDDVWVVAPSVERSGAGHSLTIHEPLRPRQISEKRFAISGTPTDCVMVAINHLMKDNPPDLVLSGINHGPNLGEDVHYSGTVAAAMEGVLLGVPSIALSSMLHKPGVMLWETAERFAPEIIRKACSVGWGRNVLINVNFPGVKTEDVKGVTLATQGKHKLGDDMVLREDPRGLPYLWISTKRLSDSTLDGTDLKAIEDGYIAVTPLSVDLTHGPSMQSLSRVFPAI
jgi:5'-nucleotidase